jgi:hypothetical protein
VAYPEAKDAANLGDCKKAQAIIAAASAMGAASGRLQSVLDTPSCKK